jgi:hypothetical protein
MLYIHILAIVVNGFSWFMMVCKWFTMVYDGDFAWLGIWTWRISIQGLYGPVCYSSRHGKAVWHISCSPVSIHFDAWQWWFGERQWIHIRVFRLREEWLGLLLMGEHGRTISKKMCVDIGMECGWELDPNLWEFWLLGAQQRPGCWLPSRKY